MVTHACGCLKLAVLHFLGGSHGIPTVNFRVCNFETHPWYPMIFLHNPTTFDVISRSGVQVSPPKSLRMMKKSWPAQQKWQSWPRTRWCQNECGDVTISPLPSLLMPGVKSQDMVPSKKRCCVNETSYTEGFHRLSLTNFGVAVQKVLQRHELTVANGSIWSITQISLGAARHISDAWCQFMCENSQWKSPVHILLWGPIRSFKFVHRDWKDSPIHHPESLPLITLLSLPILSCSTSWSKVRLFTMKYLVLGVPMC